MAELQTLVLSAEHKAELERRLKSDMTPVGHLRRVRILLSKAEGHSSENVAKIVGVNVKTVDLWVNRYRNRSAEDTLDDLLGVAPGRGRKSEVVGDAYNFIVKLACCKPVELGLPEELWSIRSMTRFLNEQASARFPRLAGIAPSTVYKILAAHDLKPWQIEYYCEKRDEDFEAKEGNVLRLYKIINLTREEQPGSITVKVTDADGNVRGAHILSYDEKPGAQATGSSAEDLKPQPDKTRSRRRSRRKGAKGSRGTGTFRKSMGRARRLASAVCRDYEYVRYGTISLLAAMDLMTGYVHPYISETHKSRDYIELLKSLDEYYPEEDLIVLVLDNLRVHTSKETVRYLRSRPGRFAFVFTPKHASWLNMIESFFSKVQRCFLESVRVNSKEELSDRLMAYLATVNAHPVVYHWKWGLEDLDISEGFTMVTLLEEPA